MTVKLLPKGATHRHKQSDQFLRVARNRVFRLNDYNEWVASNVSMEELKRSGVELNG